MTTSIKTLHPEIREAMVSYFEGRSADYEHISDCAQCAADILDNSDVDDRLTDTMGRQDVINQIMNEAERITSLP